MQTGDPFLEAAKQGLHELGYAGELIQENYAFADFGGSDPVVRQIPLAAFGHMPTSFESAWIGMTIGHEDARSLRRFHALGAPQLLVVDGNSVGRWKMPATGDPILQEHFSSNRLVEVIRERQNVWGRDVVARAKTISFSAEPLQLDFYDAGLVPAIESAVRSKLDRLLSAAIAGALKAYQEHLTGDPDLPGLYRLVFRLLAAKLLEDRGLPGPWIEGEASEVVARVERYYYGDQPIPPAVSHPEVQRAAWHSMRSGFHLQNVSVRTLAYIYENTLVSRDTRKRLSIHGTPPEIAEYIVRRLPFERLGPNERQVFEPFAGHAVFLIAALGRLRELLDPDLSDHERHTYFVRMLSGLEAEPFAIEVARLSLMLADYPNPDGWQLEHGDVFAARTLPQKLANARAVLCNPPFEDFSLADRHQYGELRSVNQAADVLDRVLDTPPALLGFVLPRSFRDGQSFREVRKRLVARYGTVEIIELPDRTFAHSKIQALLLLAQGPNQGHVDLTCAIVERQDLRQFLTIGEPTWSSVTRIPTSEAVAMPVLWRFPLEEVWSILRDYPTLDSVAEVHRGIEYRMPLKTHRDELILDNPREGFALGLVNVEDDYGPFSARPRQYLNMSPDVMLYDAYRLPWGRPKVIVNKTRQSVRAWRLSAIADHQGLVVYQNFAGIWPTGDWPIEVISAVLNGYVANAFIDIREERDNRLQTIKSVPLPRLAQSDFEAISRLVRQYEQAHDELDRVPSDELVNRCKSLLAEIDAMILSAYALPQDVKAELLRYFSGAVRPVSPRGEGRIEPNTSTGQLPLDPGSVDGRQKSLFENIDRPRVSQLLRAEPQLESLLLEAVDQIVNYIPDARLNLDLLTDPDYGDSEQLFLGVSTNLDNDEAMEALRRFDREWWVNHVRRSHGLLCIDLSDE